MDEYLKDLVVTRLKAIPPNVSFSVGSFGDYRPSELIKEVQKGSEIGKATVSMELNFLREMPKLSQRLGRHFGK